MIYHCRNLLYRKKQPTRQGEGCILTIQNCILSIGALRLSRFEDADTER
jgi:hypothetical protein